MHAVGIDLAWSPRNPSGVAVADHPGGTWRLRGTAADLVSNRDILKYVDDDLGDAPAVIAIDAPLVVPHQTRGRDGDRLITKVFGPFDAGVYPATRRTIGRYGGKRIWDLVAALHKHGFVHDCMIPRRKEGRFVFETYPHSATVALFRLPQILKYKPRQGRSHGDRMASFRSLERMASFRSLERHLLSLAGFDPPMVDVEKFLDPNLEKRTGGALKSYEDRLDAILCAYIAAYYWTWGTERCAIFGSLTGGYIVTPFNETLAARVPRDTRIVTYRPRTAPP